ncbi:MAG: hypothetical protein MUC78_12920, partial [Bacteroidales bacterium]|nr:hypothetical protein [Bacteroidales bacterium]
YGRRELRQYRPAKLPTDTEQHLISSFPIPENRSVEEFASLFKENDPLIIRKNFSGSPGK